MPGKAQDIVWTQNDLPAKLASLQPRLEAAVFATMSFYTTRVEGHAKLNAPWSDQTGNARNLLSAEAYRSPGTSGIVLYHQMPYGIWLEVRWSGRYAIIIPTIERFGPEVMIALRGLLGRL